MMTATTAVVEVARSQGVRGVQSREGVAWREEEQVDEDEETRRRTGCTDLQRSVAAEAVRDAAAADVVAVVVVVRSRTVDAVVGTRRQTRGIQSTACREEAEEEGLGASLRRP